MVCLPVVGCLLGCCGHQTPAQRWLLTAVSETALPQHTSPHSTPHYSAPHTLTPLISLQAASCWRTSTRCCVWMAPPPWQAQS